MATPKQVRLVDPEPEITLGSLVRAALEEVDGNAEKAASRVYYQLKNDKPLLEKVIKVAIKLAILDRTHHTIGDRRKSIIRSIDIQQARLRDKDRVVALAEAISSCLLDMPMVGGRMRLRDASHADVMAQAERYEKMAGGMSHKARWLRMIAQSVPAGRHVGSVITEKRALELFNEAREPKEHAS